MAKKNNKAKHKQYNSFLIAKERERERKQELKKKRKVIKEQEKILIGELDKFGLEDADEEMGADRRDEEMGGIGGRIMNESMMSDGGMPGLLRRRIRKQPKYMRKKIRNQRKIRAVGADEKMDEEWEDI
eukprot:TRINITY_DN0_c1936_g1_i1.p1 TRINITY_DN0_c1936_g1~~TRINITY_DN0_c1936_g1_i1.p1  ORF type:complete len:129 (-),score=51.40 TRINITY_DN0_c1936_g1_i1:25-411(-)